MDRLMTLVYDELRAVARRQLRRFRPGQTIGGVDCIVRRSFVTGVKLC